MDKNKKDPKNLKNDDTLYDPITGKKLVPHSKKSKKGKKFLNINSDYAVFYIVTLIIAVIISVILFAAMFNRVRDDSPIEDNDLVSIDDIVVGEDEVAVVGVIQEIDSVNRVIHVYDINSRNTYSLNVIGSTDLRDRFNQGLVFAEFNRGDIVEATFDPSNNTLSSLRISNNTWERRFVSGLEVNQNNNTITVNGDTFTYTDQIQILNNGESYSIANIHPLNIVTMRGINNTVWFMEVERGFGTVRVINGNHIVNGSMEIARSVSIPIGENVDPNLQETHMQEGTHRVSVRGSNIAPYTREITVSNGETTIVDLSTIPLTSGTLTISTNVPSAAVSVNGTRVDISQPVPINFGQYTVSAQAAGYAPFETLVTVNNANQQLQITLQPETVSGDIEIRSTPSGADVFIDNTYIGITPITATVEQGRRSLTVRKDGYITLTMPIDVGANSLPFVIELQPVIPPAPTPEPTPTPVPPTTPPAPPVTDSPDMVFIPGPGQ